MVNGTPTTGGGLRVQSITDNDGVNTDLVRSFRYTQDGSSTGSTSGRLLSTPRFTAQVPLFTARTVDPEPPLPIFYCQHGAIYLYRTSSSLAQPDFSANGAIVGYSKVSEVVGPNAEGGTTEYMYKNNVDVPSTFPGIPSLSASDNGQLISETYRDNLGNTKRQVVNEYEEKESYSSRGVKVKTGDLTNNALLYVKFYDNLSKWYVLKTKTETDYISGSTQVTKTTNYAYANAVHKEVTSEAVTQSDGSVLTTKYKRISDYSTAGFAVNSVYDAMNKGHIVSPVIEQQTYVTRGGTSKLLSGLITDYKLAVGNATSLGPVVTSLGPNPTIVVPAVDHELHVSAPQACTTATCTEFESSISGGALLKNGNYEPMETFNNYDEKGNLLQMSNNKGDIFSYKWSYNKSQPVAFITNAGYGEAAYFGFEADEEFSSLGVAINKKSSFFKTGSYSVMLSDNQIVTQVTPSTTTYKLSFWVRTTDVVSLHFMGYYGISYDHVTILCPNTAGQWQLIETNISLGGLGPYELRLSNNNSSTPIFIDDLRFHPVDAMVNTFTYKPLVGTSSVSDENNQLQNTYDYDPLGRLQAIRDRDGNIEKKFTYKYAGQ